MRAHEFLFTEAVMRGSTPTSVPRYLDSINKIYLDIAGIILIQSCLII
mgnify:CR=1 FL=1